MVLINGVFTMKKFKYTMNNIDFNYSKNYKNIYCFKKNILYILMEDLDSFDSFHTGKFIMQSNNTLSCAGKEIYYMHYYYTLETIDGKNLNIKYMLI